MTHRHTDCRNVPILEGLALNRKTSRVLIMGLGKTGLSIARFLSRLDIPFAITDTRERPPLLAELREDFPDAAVFLGGVDSAALSAASHLIVSPGLSLEMPEIRQAKRMGIPVFGDLDLFASAVNAPVIAITGANGKSTVTTLVGLMAEADGRKVRVGGNLGVPMLDLLDEQTELYVLELSSFQLERSRLFRADAATVLNISPDHMDRYPDIASYAAAKQRIYTGQGTMVLNREDPWVAAMQETGRITRWFGLGGDAVDYGVAFLEGEEWIITPSSGPLLKSRELRLQGRHNLANALAAIALADAAGVSASAMIQALKQFSGLDHRMQWVAEIDQVVWINDSKATNVGACLAALQGLDNKAVLIAGGDGKGADFSILREAVACKVRSAVLMGKDAPLLEQALKDVVQTVRVDNMKQAVKMARSLAQRGDTVLLAPACASLDQYRDFQERGRLFTDEVRSLCA